MCDLGQVPSLPHVHYLKTGILIVLATESYFEALSGLNHLGHVVSSGVGRDFIITRWLGSRVFHGTGDRREGAALREGYLIESRSLVAVALIDLMIRRALLYNSGTRKSNIVGSTMWEHGQRLQSRPKTLMTDGLSAGRAARAQTAGKGPLQRGPGNCECPCQRPQGMRIHNQCHAGLSSLLHTMCPAQRPTQALSRSRLSPSIHEA